MTDKALQRKKIIFWACVGAVQEFVEEKNYYLPQEGIIYAAKQLTDFFYRKKLFLENIYKNRNINRKIENILTDLYICSNKKNVGKQGRQSALKKLRQIALEKIYYWKKYKEMTWTHDWQEIAVQTPFRDKLFAEDDIIDDKVIDMLLSVPPRRSPSRNQKNHREERRSPQPLFPICKNTYKDKDKEDNDEK